MKPGKFPFQKIMLVCCIAIIGSCGNDTGTASIPPGFNPERIISAENKLQEILTKEMVAGLINIPTNKIEEHIENDINKKGQYTLLYSWQTGRNKTIGNTHSIAEYHSIGIAFVARMSETDFERRYGSSDGLQQQVNQMATMENLNKEVAMAEASYLSDYAQHRQTEKLDNVGTLAFWEQPVNALHILAKDAAFTITTNFGDDEQLAMKNAIRLANEILNK